MKSLFLIAALVAVTPVFAHNDNQATERDQVAAPRLVPESVVKPTDLPPDFVSARLEVEFSLDATGQPRDIKVQSRADADVRRQLVKAFRQWRFEPARAATGAGTRFILPVQLKAEA